MLINLSNHPSQKWTAVQFQKAIDKYQKLLDIPFPHIDPNWSHFEVLKLAQDYLEQIISMEPKAVHIMGEFSFTYLLVNLLREYGIPCIMSTTQRIVKVEGEKKIVTFDFKRFRNYF